MTEREKAICEVFTGICFCAGDRREAVYQYASELLGRPIFTHEFYTLADKLKELGRPIFTHEFYTLADKLKELARPDFVAMCQKVEEVEPWDKKETCSGSVSGV